MERARPAGVNRSGGALGWACKLGAVVSVVFCGGSHTREPPAPPPEGATSPVVLGSAAEPVATAIMSSPLTPPKAPPPAVPGLAPLTAGGELTALVVPNYRDAVVSVPMGATGARPIVLALHGNFDRPEWQCEVWRGLTRAFPFIVCPRGIPRPDAPASLDRWTYGKSADVRREIDGALSALRVRFGDYVAPGPVVYAGFSLGAILGVGIVASNADRFPIAVLVEGGHTNWSPALAKSYAAAGGKRVLFACGQRACKSGAALPEKVLGQAGVEVRRVFGGEVGHTYDGPVAAEIARALPWLLGDDPRWTGF
jgi:hypothetical protein